MQLQPGSLVEKELEPILGVTEEQKGATEHVNLGGVGAHEKGSVAKWKCICVLVASFYDSQGRR